MSPAEGEPGGVLAQLKAHLMPSTFEHLYRLAGIQIRWFDKVIKNPVL